MVNHTGKASRLFLNITHYFHDHIFVLFFVGSVATILVTLFGHWVVALIVLLFSVLEFTYIVVMHSNPSKRRQALLCYAMMLVLITLFYSGLYERFGIIGPDGPSFERSDCLYFSIVTLTTLGYGDFRPAPQARFWAASQGAIGYILIGILVGMIMSIYAPPAAGDPPCRENPEPRLDEDG